MNRRSNYTKPVNRDQTAEEVAEILDTNEQTIRRYAAEGCPHSRRKGRLFFNDGEVRAWMEANNKTGRPGRPVEPKAPAPPELEGDKDYWLARKYRVQCLQAEGELIPRDDVKQVNANICGAFRSGVLALPPKLAVQLEGLNAGERQEVLHSELTHLLDELSRRLREFGGSHNAAKAA